MGFDLDRAFDRRQRSPLSAQDIFQDRISEFDAFDAGLRRQLTASLEAPTASFSRYNVLTFYGQSGIGKTRLSHRLQRRFDGSSTAARRHISCRIDFRERPYLDFESAVIEFRAALGKSVKTWTAFDIAFACYWVMKHPGVPFTDFLEADSALSRACDTVDLAGQIQATLNGLVSDIPFSHAATAAVTSLYKTLRERAMRNAVLRDCPAFADILRADPEEMLPFLPYLLDWDLRRAAEKKPIAAAFFLDTWDAVQRAGDDLEDKLCRSCFLMPAALFVITGADRLTWADDDSTLHYGADYWPYLRPGSGGLEPRQHHLGYLSDFDRLDFLRKRLTVDGRPAMPDDVCQRIAAASEGLPLYLDLAAARFDELTSSGIEPHADDFGGTFPELVKDLFRDLSPEDRRLLRSAALLGSFNDPLLHASCPDVSHGTIDRFVARTFVAEHRGEWLSSSLHERLRDAVVQHDRISDDCWSAEDWVEHAERCLAWLGSQWAGLEANPSQRDRTLVSDVLVVAVRLAMFAGRVPDWLYDVSYALRLTWSSRALRLPVQSAPEAGPVRAFALACLAQAELLEEDQRSAEGHLRQALGLEGTSRYGRLFLGYRLGKTLEWQPDWQEAEQHLEAARAMGGLLGEMARKDHVWLRLWRGDSRPVKEWCEQHVEDHARPQRIQAYDLLGWASWLNGEFAEAERCFREARRLAQDEESMESVHTAVRHLALTVAWSRPDEAADLAEEALRRNTELRQRQGQAQARAAQAIALAGLGSPPDVAAHVQASIDLYHQAGAEHQLWLPLLADLFDAVSRGSSDRASVAYGRLRDHYARHRVAPHVLAGAVAWLPAEAEPPFDDEAGPDVVWLSPTRKGRGWVEALEARTRVTEGRGEPSHA